MAIVVLKCPKTGEIVCTPYPENGYEDWEVMAIDREPREGERWGENGWEPIEGLAEQVRDIEMNRLPKAVRSLLFEMVTRIYMLEQELEKQKIGRL